MGVRAKLLLFLVCLGISLTTICSGFYYFRDPLFQHFNNETAWAMIWATIFLAAFCYFVSLLLHLLFSRTIRLLFNDSRSAHSHPRHHS